MAVSCARLRILMRFLGMLCCDRFDRECRRAMQTHAVANGKRGPLLGDQDGAAFNGAVDEIMQGRIGLAQPIFSSSKGDQTAVRERHQFE